MKGSERGARVRVSELEACLPLRRESVCRLRASAEFITCYHLVPLELLACGQTRGRQLKLPLDESCHFVR